MWQRYRDKMLTYASALSDSTVNVFQQLTPAGRGHRLKGEEVLIDALLLSRCDLPAKVHVGRWRVRAVLCFKPSLVRSQLQGSVDPELRELWTPGPYDARANKGRRAGLRRPRLVRLVNQGLEDAAIRHAHNSSLIRNRFQASPDTR